MRDVTEKKSKKREVKKNEDLSDDLICRTCSNFKVEQTDTSTWVVKADSKRFGKQAIVFEGSSRREALNWMYKHIQPTKESVRRSSKRRTMKESSNDDTVGESKLHEMTSDEQREETKRLKADVRDLLDRVKFDRIPEATMAMYETDKKGFREALIQWAIECNGGYGGWTIDKIYVGSLEGKAPILYKFNNALSLIMLTTGNGAIVKIAKSGNTRVDPPWTKLDAMQTLYSWLTEYVNQ